MLSAMFITAILLLVLVIWALSGLATLPMVPMLLLAIFNVDLESSSNNECFCYDHVVDCSFRGKASLSPSDFCDVTPKVLDISWNALQSTDLLCSVNETVLCDLSEVVGNELEVLLGRGNKFVRFAAQGQPYPQLREIDLSMNSLSNVYLRDLDKIEAVNLSCNNLRTLPWTNVNVSMPNIKHIDLSHNSISLKQLDEFRFAYKLKSLNLSNNYISEFFQHGLEDLHHLEILDLSVNPLNVIYYNFSPIKSLKYLNLSHGDVYALTQETFYCLESLEVLDISHNEFIYLPTGIFKHLLALEYLDLSHNELIKTEFSKLIQETSTSLSCNNSVLYQKKNQSLAALRILNLSFNNIVGVKSDTFSVLRNLRTLDLSHNALSYFMDDAFLKLEQLQILDLSYNELTSLPPDGAFAASKNLIRLDLSHNMLMSLGEGGVFVGLGSLRELKASWNFVAEMAEGVLAPLSQLQRFDISWNVLRYAPGTTFRKLNALRYLNVSYNQLRSFPEDLLESCRIQVWLTGNELTSSPSSSLARSCAAQDRVSFYARLERAMYWPTAWFPPLPWALLLAAAVAFAAILNYYLARKHTGLLVTLDSRSQDGGRSQEFRVQEKNYSNIQNSCRNRESELLS